MNTNSKFYDVLFNHNKIIKPRYQQPETILAVPVSKRVLIFLDEEKNREKEEQTGKIMSACGLVENDYQISMPIAWKHIRAQGPVREIILFGITEEDLGLNIRFPQNRSIYFDGKTWIKTLGIFEIMANKDFKNDLWKNALKPHFIK
jgi:hypothetical protein